MLVVGIVSACLWAGWIIFDIATGAHPAADAARFFRCRVSQMLWLAACAGAWFIVGRHNEGKGETRLSYLAVFALLSAALNPVPLEAILGELRLARFDAGDVAPRSFFAAVLAFAAGLVALLRIDRSHRSLRGARLSVAAMTIAALSVVLWIGYVVVYFVREVEQARPH